MAGAFQRNAFQYGAFQENVDQVITPVGLDAAQVGTAQLNQVIAPAGLDATLFGQSSASAQLFVLPQGGSGDNSRRPRVHHDTVDIADLEEVLHAFVELQLAA